MEITSQSDPNHPPRSFHIQCACNESFDVPIYHDHVHCPFCNAHATMDTLCLHFLQNNPRS